MVLQLLILAKYERTLQSLKIFLSFSAMSHCHIWRNQPAIDTIVSKTDKANDRNMVLELCSKYGYWSGCLKILKDLGERQRQSDIILHLDDIRLFHARSPVGKHLASMQNILILVSMNFNHCLFLFRAVK